MNRLISFTGGKQDFNIDDMLWNDEATYNALNDIFRAFGDNYIIYGVTGTTSITAGYIMIDGELLKVDAHTATDSYFEKVTTYDVGGDVTFIDGIARQTWQKNRATLTASSGNLAYSGAQRGINPEWIDLSSSLTFNSTYVETGASLKYRVMLDGTIEFLGVIEFKAAAGGTLSSLISNYTSADLFGNDRKIERKYASFIIGTDDDSADLQGTNGVLRIDFDSRTADTLMIDFSFSDVPTVYSGEYGFYARVPATY